MRAAFIFPGQGSQRAGMGRSLAEEVPAARAVFEEADAALGFALSRLCFEGPDAELALTANTQPAILTVSIAALRAIEAAGGPRPEVVAGHSLGEYSALVCAGALGFADAVRLVRLRGQAMQEAVPEGVGAMAAIVGLEARTVEETCREALDAPDEEGGGEPVCAPANWNGAGQVVIAGHRAAVERAMALARAKGAKLVKALPVSAPFHSVLMRPAAERLAAALAAIEVRAPSLPIVGNVEAAPYREAERVRELLVRQVTAPVRWEESVRQLPRLGVERAVEVGPGKVLSALVRRIAPELQLSNVETPAEAAALAGLA